MYKSLTLAELAKTVTGNFYKQSPELMIRRLRHWTLAGALETDGAVHGGTGTHRKYVPETAYVATILSSLADMGFPIGVLKGVSEGLPACIKDRGEYWKSAISGEKEIYLLIIPWFSSDRGDNSVVSIMGILDQVEVMNRMKKAHETCVLNLTVMFSKLSI